MYINNVKERMYVCSRFWLKLRLKPRFPSLASRYVLSSGSPLLNQPFLSVQVHPFWSILPGPSFLVHPFWSILFCPSFLVLPCRYTFARPSFLVNPSWSILPGPSFQVHPFWSILHICSKSPSLRLFILLFSSYLHLKSIYSSSSPSLSFFLYFFSFSSFSLPPPSIPQFSEI